MDFKSVLVKYEEGKGWKFGFGLRLLGMSLEIKSMEINPWFLSHHAVSLFGFEIKDRFQFGFLKKFKMIIILEGRKS